MNDEKGVINGIIPLKRVVETHLEPEITKIETPQRFLDQVRDQFATGEYFGPKEMIRVDMVSLPFDFINPTVTVLDKKSIEYYLAMAKMTFNMFGINIFSLRVPMQVKSGDNTFQYKPPAVAKFLSPNGGDLLVALDHDNHLSTQTIYAAKRMHEMHNHTGKLSGNITVALINPIHRVPRIRQSVFEWEHVTLSDKPVRVI